MDHRIPGQMVARTLVKWNIGWQKRPFLAINPKKRTWFLGQMEYRTWFPGQMVARTGQNPGQMEHRLDKTRQNKK